VASDARIVTVVGVFKKLVVIVMSWKKYTRWTARMEFQYRSHDARCDGRHHIEQGENRYLPWAVGRSAFNHSALLLFSADLVSAPLSRLLVLGQNGERMQGNPR
jgi:hypothetical protein